MSWVLTGPGRYLFGEYFRRANLVVNDFDIVRDGTKTWKVMCPGKGIRDPVALFTGTYIEGLRALKMQLITSRLTS